MALDAAPSIVALSVSVIGGRIEFIDGVAGVAAEEEQARVAQADRVVSRPRRRQLRRIKRERLINATKIFHRVGVTAGEQNAVIGK